LGEKKLDLNIEFEEEKENKDGEAINIDSTLVFGAETASSPKVNESSSANEEVKVTTINIDDYDSGASSTSSNISSKELIDINLRLDKLENENKKLLKQLVELKLMEQKITQLLLKINAKAPKAKGELQLIKKLMTDCINKIMPN